jgi:anti-sigma factor RsiW
MNESRERLWQAYVDGELSAAEAAEFENALSPTEREKLAQETRFEHALADTLARGVSCPDAAWDRTRAKLAAARPSSRGSRWKLALAASAAAASIAIAASVVLDFAAPASDALVLGAKSIDDLKELAQTDAGSDAVRDFLAARHVHVYLKSEHIEYWMGHSGFAVLGARQSQTGRQTVTEVLLACCKRPLKAVIVERNSAIADTILKAAEGRSEVQDTRIVGDYLVALVGNHHSPAILGLFVTPEDTRLASDNSRDLTVRHGELRSVQ